MDGAGRDRNVRVCVVKQHTTYDLFTRTGPDLSAIVASSNWRSGPVGLWEAFDCSARVVYEDAAPECQIGKRHWSRYVEGWEVWPTGGVADRSDDVDWAQYDVVVSIDVAVPTRIITRFPQVMWCYYFIEGGPRGIDHEFRGSPFYGYNVFLDHRLGRRLLTAESHSARQMRATRRAVLDFPYYMQSSRSIQRLYEGWSDDDRSGVCLSHHSRDVINQGELRRLEQVGPVRTEWSTLAEIHRAELASKYFFTHPASMSRTGTAIIEAISAGCLVLAPSTSVGGFPEILVPELDYRTFDEGLDVLYGLQADSTRYRRCREEQARKVDQWCYLNPALNLLTMLEAFDASPASCARQQRAEFASQAAALTLRHLKQWAGRGRAFVRGTRVD